MSKGTPAKARKRGGAVSVDGNWLPVPCGFLASSAFATLSPLAVKMLYGVFLAQLGPGGGGNGRLDAKEERLRAAGWSSAGSASASIRELEEACLVVRTRRGAKGRLGLYGVTLWPMSCRLDALDVGPGAWATTDWRKGGAEPPTSVLPATWHRPRSRAAAERDQERNRTPRSGKASAPCASATGTHSAEYPSCLPAEGAQAGVSGANPFPLRESLSRDAIWTAGMGVQPTPACLPAAGAQAPTTR